MKLEQLRATLSSELGFVQKVVIRDTLFIGTLLSKKGQDQEETWQNYKIMKAMAKRKHGPRKHSLKFEHGNTLYSK